VLPSPVAIDGPIPASSSRFTSSTSSETRPAEAESSGVAASSRRFQKLVAAKNRRGADGVCDSDCSDRLGCSPLDAGLGLGRAETARSGARDSRSPTTSITATAVNANAPKPHAVTTARVRASRSGGVNFGPGYQERYKAIRSAEADRRGRLQQLRFGRFNWSRVRIMDLVGMMADGSDGCPTARRGRPVRRSGAGGRAVRRASLGLRAGERRSGGSARTRLSVSNGDPKRTWSAGRAWCDRP
jgi:hypothetical protein